MNVNEGPSDGFLTVAMKFELGLGPFEEVALLRTFIKQVKVRSLQEEEVIVTLITY